VRVIGGSAETWRVKYNASYMGQQVVGYATLFCMMISRLVYLLVRQGDDDLISISHHYSSVLRSYCTFDLTRPVKSPNGIAADTQHYYCTHRSENYVHEGGHSALI
jgi:hypothetical protein